MPVGRISCSTTRSLRSSSYGPGRRRHVDGLADRGLELLEGQRPVVEGRRQSEAEVDQDLLAGPVVLVHADDLGDRHVALVDDEQPVRREVVEQGPRPAPGLAPGEVARVVLDTGAVAELAHHLEVEVVRWRSRAASRTRPWASISAGALLHLGLDVDERLLELVGRRHEVGRRVDVEVVALGEQLAGERVDLGDPLDLVAEELDPDDPVLGRRDELEGVAADPEAGPLEGLVVALVLEVDQVAQDGVAPVLAAPAQAQDRGPVVDRRAEAVDAADAGHDDHVAPLEQGVGRGVAELVDLVVAARVLLDVGVRAGQVGLGLVVVEVAHEVLDRVVREELPELGVELGGQGLVVGQDQGRLLVLGDRVGDRPGLARAGDAHQGLVPDALAQPVDQARDRGRLVTGRLEVGNEAEVRHGGRSAAPGAGLQDITPRTNRTRVRSFSRAALRGRAAPPGGAPGRAAEPG